MNVGELREKLGEVGDHLNVQVVVDLGDGETTVTDFATDETTVDGQPVFTIKVEN
jgi:hypothetical protein